MTLLERYTPNELEYLAGLPLDDPEQKLTVEQIEETRALLASIDKGVDFIAPVAVAI